MDDRDFAVLVESLYVANLLILPVLAFIILALIFIKKHGSLPALADSHLEQTMSASIWIGVFFFITAITVMLMNLVGIEDVTLWIIAIITYTIIHATMVLFGVFGLAKALAGKCWRYPLVGKPLPADCP
jgi:ABC-type multidrug transport system permease subunit